MTYPKTGKTRSTRLAGFELLESRDLLASDVCVTYRESDFLASTLQVRHDSALVSNPPPIVIPLSSAAAPLAAVASNNPPAGSDKTISTLEDSSYTFSAADFGFSDPLDGSTQIVAPTVSNLTPARVLVLYNVQSSDGTDIVNYYAQIHPGVHLLGITGVSATSEDITADAYLATIRPQVMAALTNSIDVIVTTKGLPLRINVTEAAPTAPFPTLPTYVDTNGVTHSVLNWKSFSSLESELAGIDTINMWQLMGDQTSTGNPYYLSNSAFSHATSGTRLTARLDGYTVADVKASIDRAQQAVIGSNYFLVDNDPSIIYAPSMANLVNNVLVPKGVPVVYDNTSAFLSTAPGPVIGYDGHGAHQASTPALYIANGLNITLANGAVFESWESYNAYSFNSASTAHLNQGQVAQWLKKGGTAGVGNVEEPGASTATFTNEDQMFKMLLNGYTFAEAAWSGTEQLSYVNTMVGDPLMTWSTATNSSANTLLAVKISTLPAGGALTNNGVAVTAGQLVSAADILAGKLKFTPAANAAASGYASFTFQVQDNGGTANGGMDLDPTPNTITVNVTAVNDPPSGTNKTVTTLQDTAFTFTSADFGFTDPNDSPANPLTAVKISTLPSAGTLTNNGVAITAGQFISAADITAGKLKFTPAAGATGTSYASFTFQVQDNGGTTNGGVDLDPTPNTITVNVTAPVDTTPPTVTGLTPANGASGVTTSAVASITFNEAINAATITAATVSLRDANNAVVPAALAYNAATKTATLTPTSALANAASYTVVVKGGSSGVKDSAGNALVTDVTASFTTSAAVTPTTASLWPASASPALLDSGDAQSVELGTRFSSDVSGTITGVRFYKSAGNTGTHTASLWTASGVLLATATFTSETASGWQQVNFATPVSISAGVTYVVSYHTNSGHYSISRPYFSTQYNNGPLHVPANGGVYLYGTGMPTNSFQGTNYWVDVVLNTTPPVDTTPPTVTGLTPANGVSGVTTSAVASITFNEAINAATITAATVSLRDANNAVVPAALAYNAATKTATLTPTSALANAASYTVVVKGGSSGVKDSAGNALVTDVTASFTTSAAVTPTTASLWPASASPALLDSGDAQSVELGTRFSSDVSGTITGVRFYKSAGNTGTHTASLWTASGVLLATATFTSETASGWQQVNFATPVSISAGVTYVVSYHTNSGHYSISRPYFSTQYNNGPLHVPANGGVYLYGTGMPTNSFQGTNYWVDVVLNTTPPVDTTPPTVTGLTPANGVSGVTTSAVASITFNEAINAATITAATVSLRDANNAVVPAALAYNAATKTATLTPTSALANAASYTVVVKGGSSGVKDSAGNALVTDVTASFTTSAAVTPTTASLWPASASPALLDSGDAQSVELGTRFSSDVSGTITGVRFYKSAGNTGTHTASLWTASGVLLATATFTSETASGWQQVNFATPVSISAGVTYVVSYHTNSGHYSISRPYFSTQYNNGPLHVPANGGVYLYGTGMPTNSFQGTNYWVDVVFAP